MRHSALFLSALVLSGSACLAQTGFSAQSYPGILPSSSDNTRLLSADFNGDGRPDLLSYGSRFSGPNNAANVFLNNGSGGFLAPTPLSGSALIQSAQIGDMDGDGYPDFVGCQNTGTGANQAVLVTVYLNNGNGTFRPLPGVGAQGQCFGLTLGDVFHNGHLAAVTAGYTLGQYDPSGKFYPGVTNYVSVFSNDGTGHLAQTETTTANLDDAAKGSSFTQCGAIGVVGADFLQDGRFDLVITSQCAIGQNQRGNTGTTFLGPENANASNNNPAYTTTFNLLNSAYETYNNGHVADVNGDGKLDVVFPATPDGFDGDLIYAMNNGSGSFSFTSLFANTIGAEITGGATVADFNGDGFKDVATTYNRSSDGAPVLTILNGAQNGTFTQSQTFATGPTTSSSDDVVAADFNGDGKPDLATLVYDQNSRTTSLIVYTNTQSQTSTACSAPATAGTNRICSPANGSTQNSPVTVNAASNVTGFTLNRLYLDNNSVYQTTSQTVSTPINAAAGNHSLVLVSYDNQGHAYSSTSSFTVGTGSNGGCSASSAGVNICSPAAGSTDASPVTITAGAMAASGNITAIRAYIDNVAVFTVNNPSATNTFTASQAVTVASGAHTLVVLGYQNTGGQVSRSETFTVAGGPCYPSSAGAKICSPAANATTSSPVSVVAGVTTNSGYVAAIRVYIDNVAQPVVNNPGQTKSFEIRQSETVAPGSHNLVVVGYPSTGGSISSRETFTAQ